MAPRSFTSAPGVTRWVPLGLIAVAVACGVGVACSGGTGGGGEVGGVAVTAPAEVDPAPWLEARSGGMTTTFREGPEVFGLPARNLGTYDSTTFFDGRTLFNESLASRGLGPRTNAVSCLECHRGHGSGTVPGGDSPDAAGGIVTEPGLLVRLSRPGTGPHGEPLDDERLGGQVQDRVATPPDDPAAAAEPAVAAQAEARVEVRYRTVEGAYGDGTRFSLREPQITLLDLVGGPLAPETMQSARLAPPVIGLGLLDAIPEETILAAADPDDADGDGISGRANRVWDRGRLQHTLGRFGWKAGQPNVDQQTAAALEADLGVTSPLYPDVSLDAAGAAPAAPELSVTGVYPLTFYTQALAVPAVRNVDDPEVRRGAALFAGAGCGSCHTTDFRTGPAVKTAFADQIIRPYTDLLLHDLGPGLADGRPEYEATGSEWRTPPLWGLGRRREASGVLVLLHDGRARSVAEAVLWHGGEAEAAKERFRLMSAVDRAALIRFLEAL